MKTKVAVFLSIIISCSFCWVALGMEGPPPILNPTSYTSPSGEYELSVNPSDLYGRGPADYRFSRLGEEVWSKRLPFTLWEAGVADSGHIGGYAYSHGWRGFSEKGFSDGMGDFTVSILSPTGEILGKHVTAREQSNFLHTPPNPLADGLVIDNHTDRLIVRIADADVNRRIEQWWIYELTSGKQIDTIEPKTQMAGGKQRISILSAKAVPTTPLILVHWWNVDYPRLGSIFTLVDEAGKPVWTLTLDTDYYIPSDRAQQDEIRQHIWKHGAILDVGSNGKAGTFDLHFVKEGARASFSVEKTERNQWKVEKTGQMTYQWPRYKTEPEPEPEPLPQPTLTLKKIGETALSQGNVNPKHPIRNLVAFDFDPLGRICALRAEHGIKPCLVYVTQEGDVLKELYLPVEELPEYVGFSNPANVGEDRFVVSISSQGVDGMAEFFLADFSAGTVKKLANVSCPSTSKIAGFPDGRFVALTNHHMRYTIAKGLFFFDRQGNLLWSKEQDGYSGKAEELLGPKDIAAYGSKEIAVLCNTRNRIQIFDVRGKFQYALDLKKAWRRRPNYLTAIAADVDAGFIVYDFNARQTLLRLDAQGKIRDASSPKFSDGRPLSVVGGVKRSPEGVLWTSDGESLFRLSDQSIVNRTLGSEPLPQDLGDPEHVEVGMDDRVYVADRRTKSVHVFDAEGKHLGHCIPNADDLMETSWISNIAASPEGKVYYLTYSSGPKRFLGFDKDFNRIGWFSVDVDPIHQDWLFQPTNDLCWIVGYHDIFLVRSLSEVVRRISRRSDERWLEYPEAAAVASDGSLAVVARSQSGEVSVCTCGPTGDARSTFRIPKGGYFASIAFNGGRIYIRSESAVMMFDRSGEPLGTLVFDSGAWPEDWTGPYLAAGGNELWCISMRNKIIYRYAVPEQLDSEARQTD